MAERNQVMGLLGRHRAGDDRGLKHRALGGRDIAVPDRRAHGFRKSHEGAGMRGP